MSLTCHCYRCNVVDYSANAYFSLNNEDEQNLILQICKGIFKAIQDEKFSMEISYNGISMTHKQIHNISQVENCIDRQFSQLFRDDILRKEVKSHQIGTWRIEFKWTELDNNSLIKGLLKISREWYNPFTNYLQKINNQKRNEWSFDPDISKDERELKKYLLSNLENYLPGFEYLLEYSWKSHDNNNFHEVDFVFASDSGIFIVVKAKCERDVEKSRNESNSEDKNQALEYKNQASEEFNGKYITVLGANFMYNLNENTAMLEFIDNDENIAKYFKEIYGSKKSSEYQDSLRNRDASSRSYNNHQTPSRTTATLTQQVKDDDSSSRYFTSVASGVAAVAAAGYMFYQAFSRRNDDK